MKRLSLTLLLSLLLIAPLDKAQVPLPAIDGDWVGSIAISSMHLRIVIRLATTPTGLTASLQSPDQSPQWIPADSVKMEGDTVTVNLSALQATYIGKLSADRKSMEGTFTQMGTAMPLTLTHAANKAQVERKRPQMPVAPFHYKSEDVTYENKAGGNTLAATLTLPEGNGPYPAVLLICGSGAHDRDESLLGHKPFLVLADALTRRGIVVLRADKRGVGKSTGDYKTATTADFATDAEAGIDYLLTRPEIDAHRIGLIGHSEGGVIAPMVAARNAHVDFIVMMAGPGVPGDQLITEQGRLIALVGGEDKKKADDDAIIQQKIFTTIETEKDAAARDKTLRALLLGAGIPEQQIDLQIKAITSPWFMYFITYDPAATLSKVTIPVLALNGEKDLQVPPKQNLPVIRKALDAAGNKHYEADELPGLNHLFQTAKTGAPSEYVEIEETIAPSVLKQIGDWILAQK
jgi:hypothetical protein